MKEISIVPPKHVLIHFLHCLLFASKLHDDCNDSQEQIQGHDAVVNDLLEDCHI